MKIQPLGWLPTLSLLFFIPFAVISFGQDYPSPAPDNSGDDVPQEAIEFRGELDLLFNDTDLGGRRPTQARGLPLFQGNDFNKDLDGNPVSDDDRIPYGSAFGADFTLSARGKVGEDLIAGVNIEGNLDIVRRPGAGGRDGTLRIRDIRLSRLSVDKMLIAQIGDIHPFFSEYTLDRRQNGHRGALVNVPVGDLVRGSTGADVGALTVTGVAALVEPPEDYPAGESFTQRRFLGAYKDEVFKLVPPAGVKEVKEDTPTALLDPLSPVAGEYRFFIWVDVITKSDELVAIVDEGRAISPFEDWVFLDPDRVKIKGELFEATNAKEVIVQWATKDPRGRRTMYLNGARIGYSPVGGVALGASYVNLHNDLNSIRRKEVAERAIHGEIFSGDISLEPSEDTAFRLEYAHSRYEPNVERNAVYDVLFYALGSQKFRNPWGVLSFRANYRNIGADYILNVAPLRYTRHLIEDGDDNDSWDYEDRYFPIGERGAGGGVGYEPLPGLAFDLDFDWQGNEVSGYLTKGGSPPEHRLPKAGLDEVETFTYEGSAKYSALDSIESSNAYAMKKHRGGFTKTYSQMENSISFKPIRGTSLSLGYRYPLPVGRLYNTEREFSAALRLDAPPLVSFGIPLSLYGEGESSWVWDSEFAGQSFRRLIEVLPGAPIDLRGRDTVSYGYEAGLEYEISPGLFAYLSQGIDFFTGRDRTGVDLSYDDGSYTLGARHNFGREDVIANLYYTDRSVSFRDAYMSDKYSFRAKSIVGELSLKF